MNQINLPRRQPTESPRPSSRRTLLWTGITALIATAAFGFVVPRLVGHGHAQASAIPSRAAASVAPGNAGVSKSAPSSTTWDGTVPAASDVFENRENGAVVGSSAPTF